MNRRNAVYCEVDFLPEDKMIATARVLVDGASGLEFDYELPLVSHAFGTMRLHRIEAACIPRNARSIRVLEKAGFTREGLLRSYLCINGTWQDHFIYALIADEHRDGSKRG